VLQDLEDANAFVVALDAERSWFRYHHLFAGLLQLELRHTEPGEVAALHELAAGWLAGHQFGVEAIRHAQAARDWGLAGRLLADHRPGLHLDGQAATVHALLAGFPAGARTADTELAVLAAADELAQGSLEAAERYLGRAERGLASVPAARRRQAQALFGMVRLEVTWHQGNLPAVPEQAQRLQALAEAPEAAQPSLGDELRALALISLGDTETWTARPDQAESHLEQGVALARRMGRPHLEFRALLHLAEIDLSRRLPRAAERSRQATDLAERNGWTDQMAAGLAYMTHGSALAWLGRLDEAAASGPASYRARRSDRPDPRPAGRQDGRVAARAAAAARAAQQKRDPGAALPADPSVGTGDRRRAVRLDEHGQDPHAQPVRQARRAPPGRGHRACPRSGPARTVRTPALTHRPSRTRGRVSSGIVRIVRWPLIVSASRLVTRARRNGRSFTMRPVITGQPWAPGRSHDS
jgi:LuxR family transcriptional regulator, maltose regulon positive regulatory protein